MSKEMQDSIADINEEQLDTMLEDVEVKDEEILEKYKDDKEEDDKAEVEVEDDESEVEDDDEDEAKKVKKEEVEEVEEVEEAKVDFSDDLNALVEGEESLAEGFKDKAALIFEAAISSKLKVEVAKLEESYESKLEEAATEVRESLVDKVDSYLNYVVEQWVEDNKVAIESGLRTEITESFISSLKDVFVNHNIDVPEDKVSLVDELAEQVTKLEEQLNESVQHGIALSERVHNHEKVEAIAEACIGMTELDIDKFNSLIESIDYDNKEQFTSKIETIKESYFKVKSAPVEEELLTADSNTDNTLISPSMAAYVSAIHKNQSF